MTSPQGLSAAQFVLHILATGGYEAPSGNWVSIRDEQAAAEAGTKLYTPEELAIMRDRLEPAPEPTPPAIAILDATTQQAARELTEQGDVVLLNFASAKNPGGGFFGGAKAQEEELCRCSGLYQTLLTQPDYYATNRERRSLLYQDCAIYSPRVPFFRVDTKAPLLESLYFPSVITGFSTQSPRASAVGCSVATFRWRQIGKSKPIPAIIWLVSTRLRSRESQNRPVVVIH